MHEKMMHEQNCVLTLTYDDEHLPKDLSLNYRDFQLFMKRLRKHFSKCGSATTPKKNFNLRFYMGGEYGEKYGRPHYHVALFGINFPDKKYHKKSPAGFPVYKSATLDKIWQNGYAGIGELTFESAAYIARYIMKKRTGDGNKTHYEIIDMKTGEIQLRKKEFNQMSRGKGIGLDWLKKYTNDAYPEGKVVVREHKQQTPRYYDKKWAEQEPTKWEELQYQRYKEGLAYITDRTPERLAVQEQVQNAKTKTLKREFK